MKTAHFSLTLGKDTLKIYDGNRLILERGIKFVPHPKIQISNIKMDLWLVRYLPSCIIRSDILRILDVVPSGEPSDTFKYRDFVRVNFLPADSGDKYDIDNLFHYYDGLTKSFVLIERKGGNIVVYNPLYPPLEMIELPDGEFYPELAVPNDEGEEITLSLLDRLYLFLNPYLISVGDLLNDGVVVRPLETKKVLLNRLPVNYITGVLYPPYSIVETDDVIVETDV